MALFGRTVVVCRKAVDLFTDYLEDALPSRDRARLEGHLAGCPRCAEHLRQMRTTIGALGQVGPDTPAPETCDELIALYQRWVADLALWLGDSKPVSNRVSDGRLIGCVAA